MIRRPPRSTLSSSSAASDVYKRQTRKVKPIWTLQKQETVSGSGISWAICKSAPSPDRQPHQHSTTLFFTGWMPFLPPNQQRQSTESKAPNCRTAYITASLPVLLTYCLPDCPSAYPTVLLPPVLPYCTTACPNALLSMFYLQIPSAEVGSYICNRPVTGINVVVGFCTWNLQIKH